MLTPCGRVVSLLVILALKALEFIQAQFWGPGPVLLMTGPIVGLFLGVRLGVGPEHLGLDLCGHLQRVGGTWTGLPLSPTLLLLHLAWPGDPVQVQQAGQGHHVPCTPCVS